MENYVFIYFCIKATVVFVYVKFVYICFRIVLLRNVITEKRDDIIFVL